MVSRTRHDDVIKWKHFPRYWPFVGGIHRSSVCAWTNGWTNNRETGDLIRHHALYDVTVMRQMSRWCWCKILQITLRRMKYLRKHPNLCASSIKKVKTLHYQKRNSEYWEKRVSWSAYLYDRNPIPTKSDHDDVIKLNHFPRYWPFVQGTHRSPVNSQHKGQWRGALMFSLICAWKNAWVSNREAADLRCYRAHHDVTVMNTKNRIRPEIYMYTQI